ncbi:MAG: sigma-54-dependent transcriptional regulator [Spirochaetota bacterium]
MNRKILIVDDEETQANIIASILQREGYDVQEAYSAEEALKMVSRDNFSVLLVDMKMPGIGGMGLLEKAKERGVDASIIIMTAYGTIETAVEAMKRGAFHYITKPFGGDELLLNVARAVEAFNLQHQNVQLKEELRSIYDEQKILGVSEAIGRIHELIEKLAANDDANVLITGESGTGKELVARAIHMKSRRNDMPFVPVNCSAIPESLLESELFGYEKGAFTGAVSKRDGKFKTATGGTIFLDEIGDMPISMQAKLLRVIQDREITPIGGDESIKVDVRIISATNRNIEGMVKSGAFREDLYFRLNVVPIHIPPLRERKEDIEVLVDAIVKNLNRKLKRNVSGLPREVLLRLKQYHFPGNVRELENMLERAFILAGDSPITMRHFPMLEYQKEPLLELGNGLTLKEISKAARSRAEREAIEVALRKTNWNRVKAARMLGVDYKTLRSKIEELEIHPEYRDKEKR